MVKMSEVEKLALPERAILATHLLDSLPAVLHDQDDGYGEALRRDADLKNGNAKTLSVEELTNRIRSRRKG